MKLDANDVWKGLASDAKKQIVESYNNYIEETNSEIYKSLKALYDSLNEELVVSLHGFAQEIISEISLPPLSDSAREAIAPLLTYTESNALNEDAAECVSIVNRELQREKNSDISFDRMLAIISLLLTVLSYLSSMKPDAQQAEIISQNNILIEQGYEQHRLEQESLQQNEVIIELLQRIAEASHECNCSCCDTKELADFPDAVSNGIDVLHNGSFTPDDRIEIPDNLLDSIENSANTDSLP